MVAVGVLYALVAFNSFTDAKRSGCRADTANASYGTGGSNPQDAEEALLLRHATTETPAAPPP